MASVQDVDDREEDGRARDYKKYQQLGCGGMLTWREREREGGKEGVRGRGREREGEREGYQWYKFSGESNSLEEKKVAMGPLYWQ